MQTRLGSGSIVLWLGGCGLALFFALLLSDSAFIDGEYIPRANDSFYHARRILDAAVGERGFYEIDERLQVPEGAWIPWPWAYDYLMSKLVQVAVLARPSIDALGFLLHIPVTFLLVNVALFIAASTPLGLAPGLRTAAVLAFSLSPLVQLLHAVGMIDHHFIELTFVLATAALGLRWFREPEELRIAATLGGSLGVATAFHNGLFLLQLPVLACVGVLWLRGAAPRRRALLVVGSALVAASLVSTLPSEAFRRGMFEFALLSWFHVYVAACSAALLAFFGIRRRTRATLVGLAAFAALLATPILSEIERGARFFSGDISVLAQIGEVASPLAMLADAFMVTAGLYSLLLLLAPPLLAYYVWRCFRETRPERLFYAIFATFGLALLLMQYRFHYFGLYTLVTAPLLLFDCVARRTRWHPGLAVIVALGAVLLLYQPALRGRLFMIYAPGADAEYAGAHAIFNALALRCAEQPGLVLASHDDGNALLFHTECSVLANNFILRAQDEAKIAEVVALMRSSPETIRRHRPEIRYVFLRTRQFASTIGREQVLDPRNVVAKELLIDARPPAGFKLLETIEREPKSPRDSAVYARLYEIER